MTEEQVIAESMERLRVIKDQNQEDYAVFMNQKKKFIQVFRDENVITQLRFNIPSWNRGIRNIKLIFSKHHFKVPVILFYDRHEYKDGKHIGKHYSNFRLEMYFESEFINDKIISTGFSPDHVVFATEITTYDENNEVVSREDWMYDENGIATLL